LFERFVKKTAEYKVSAVNEQCFNFLDIVAGNNDILLYVDIRLNRLKEYSSKDAPVGEGVAGLQLTQTPKTKIKKTQIL
jgi:hypothetical protein